MKKNTKQVLSAVAAIAVLSSGITAFADYVPGKEIDPTIPSTKSVTPNYTLKVDGNVLEGANIYISDARVMIPLRMVAEALGYKVTWNEEAERVELERLPHWITLTPGEDAYTFSKTAPMPLGKAPELVNDTTFVPVEFVRDILQTEYTISNQGEIVIGETAAATPTAVISSIDGKDITIEDSKLGTVILHVSDETVILGKDGKEAKLEDLKAEMDIVVEYGPAMTASEPPQNTPVKIQMIEKIDGGMDVTPEQKFTKEGVIQSIEEEKVIIGEKDPNSQTALIVTDDTKISGEDGKALTLKDLKAGQNVTAVHSMRATFSIPPQTVAYEIIVSETSEEESMASKAAITDIDDKTVTVKDEKIGDVILHISDETKILDKDGKDISIDKLEKDMTVLVEYSPAMTASLPPQNTPVKIQLTDQVIAPVKTFVTEGEIVSIEEDRIIIGEEDPNTQTALIFSDKTVIHDENGKALTIKDLKAGMEITAIHSMAATFSIPPQTAVYEIIVEVEDEKDEPEKNGVELKGEIRAIEESRVTVGPEDYQKQTILIVTDDTKIQDEDGNALTLKDLKEGMEIAAVHSEVSTRSLPPQTVAFEITVVD